MTNFIRFFEAGVTATVVPTSVPAVATTAVVSVAAAVAVLAAAVVSVVAWVVSGAAVSELLELDDPQADRVRVRRVAAMPATSVRCFMDAFRGGV